MMSFMRKVALLMLLGLVVGACGNPEPKTADDAKEDASEDDAKPKKKKKAKKEDSEDKPAESDGEESAGSGTAEKGKKAPTFSLKNVNGKGKVTIPEGKVVIVDFWATWCEPCKKSFPKFQELYVKYKASGLEIAAVSVDDDKDGIAEFAKTHGAKFPVGWDKGHKVADVWKPPSMPTTIVVDKKGIIRHIHTGYHDGEEAELEKEIKDLL